ncbi:MAG: EAL domain-containing protein [Gammaproteobacteria bacterium]|jgi:diguanylate cyclase (GGDEF)-like protein/PAS domain S-box-containing protein
MENQTHAFQAKLPARITGIVFWGLVFIGLLISVFILEDAENELYAVNKTNSHMVAYALDGIVKKHTESAVLDNAAARIEQRLNRLRHEMGFTSVVLSEDNNEYVYGEKNLDDDVFPYSIYYYPKGSTQLKTITALVYYPNQSKQVTEIRKNMLLTIGLSVFVFGLVLQQILHHVLSGPFLKMVNTARAFSSGDEWVRFNDNRNDEFGYLAGFINNAIESILTTQRQLREALKRAEKSEIELSHQKEVAEVTLHSITDSVITVDLDGVIQYINPAAELLFNTSNAEVNGDHLTELVSIISESSGEHASDPLNNCFKQLKTIHIPEHSSLMAGHNRVIAIEASVTPMKNNRGDVIGAVMVIQDVSHTRKLTRQLSYQASHDMLTGLYNRLKFEECLEDALLNVKEEQRVHTLCYLDLDQFKLVNDTCGHIAGDELLRQLPDLFHKVLRSGDIVARLGGDEFGILLENCEIDQATMLADKIREEIKEFRFVWEDKVFTIGVSIGVVGIDENMSDISKIMSSADVACYAAKDSGRNRVHVYECSDELVSERHGQMHWTGRITRAMEEDRFMLYRQPIVGFSNDGHEHFEVLLRMIDEKGNIVPPGAFIPAAERYNLMTGIDRWVIKEVFKLIADDCVADPVRHLDRVISINLSGDSLSDESLYDYIISLKDEFNVSLNNVCFEITETVAISNLVKATALINELKQYGCRFSLDDFGSGLSSFTYLKNLPVNYLKIDGSFVKDVSRDPVDRAMVVSIQQMGSVMKLDTIAEWVEDEETLHTLWEIGVDYVQGYHLGKPEAIKPPVTEIRQCAIS